MALSLLSLLEKIFMSIFCKLSTAHFRFLKNPRPVARDSQRKQNLDLATRDITLYYFPTCPFCIKVRSVLYSYGLSLEKKNINRDPEARKELLAGGGSTMVPCLRIGSEGGSTWLYESSDIIRYLKTLAD